MGREEGEALYEIRIQKAEMVCESTLSRWETGHEIPFPRQEIWHKSTMSDAVIDL